MSLRETINKNPAATLGVTIAILVVAAIFINPAAHALRDGRHQDWRQAVLQRRRRRKFLRGFVR